MEKIVVAVRCYNEEKNIERFLKGYSFADTIVVSDGGSTDNSVALLQNSPKVNFHRFTLQETINEEIWNPDNPHINYVLKLAYDLNPDWVIFDDMDCVPNQSLRENAREILETCDRNQVNVFRLYMWGDKQYFPYMNRNFDPAYRSLWAWKPNKVKIHADESVQHGTLRGLIVDYYPVELPNCLLHKSYDPKTIDRKIERYRRIGIAQGHPLEHYGEPKDLPEFAHE